MVSHFRIISGLLNKKMQNLPLIPVIFDLKSPETMLKCQTSKRDASAWEPLATSKTLHIVRHGESEQNVMMFGKVEEILRREGKTEAADKLEAAGAGGLNQAWPLMEEAGIFEVMQSQNPETEGYEWDLSDRGRRQAVGLTLDDEDFLSSIELIVASPQRRAMTTAQLGYGDLIDAGSARAIVLEDARETGGERRRTVSEIKASGEFSDRFDFSQVGVSSFSAIFNRKMQKLPPFFVHFDKK